jgi:hypothetical protein
VQNELLERIATLGHDQQAARFAPGDKGLFDGPAAGHDLVTRLDQAGFGRLQDGSVEGGRAGALGPALIGPAERSGRRGTRTGRTIAARTSGATERRPGTRWPADRPARGPWTTRRTVEWGGPIEDPFPDRVGSPEWPAGPIRRSIRGPVGRPSWAGAIGKAGRAAALRPGPLGPA